MLEEKRKDLQEISPSFAGEIEDHLANGFDRHDDIFYTYTTDEIVKCVVHQQDVQFECMNGTLFQISICTPSILQFRFLPYGTITPYFSYAVMDNLRIQTQFICIENEEYWEITTSELKCIVKKSDGSFIIKNHENQIVIQSNEGYYAKETVLKGFCTIQMSLKADSKDHYFGMGDKSCSLDLNGKSFENWVTDAYHFEPETDPLYRAIPFFFGLHDGLGYGIYFDNSHKSHFDFNSNQDENLSFYAEGGEMNFYFMYGPDLTNVAQQYVHITGVPELPPVWALGYHQCRWSYYPESRVMELATTFRDLQIPCDAIYLDIDYMDGYRCFTWNHEHFPDPKQMVTSLKSMGFETVVMIDPGIKEDPGYFVYDEGIEKDFFCKRADGTLMIGTVWPGRCVFPDYTHPEVRDWWGELYRHLYEKVGISGFWNDMNEPALFKLNKKTFPDTVRHDYDGHPTNHAQAHNIYGMQMSRASWDGFKRILPEKRPFLLTRASFSGGQRYAAIWTGDNVATWSQLKMAIRQCIRLSISGYSMCGSDIGGFVDVPSGELFLRWLQAGIFHPVFRVHSMGNHDSGEALVEEETLHIAEATVRVDQEPWSFGELYTALAKTAIEFRYQLLPYLYTALHTHHTTGTPVISPLSFFDQHDPKCLLEENGFFFGQNMLVYPVLEKGVQVLNCYLPKGIWFKHKNGEIYLGSQTISIPVGLDSIPVFVKAGAVIPIYPVRQHTGEKVEELELHAYFNEGIHQSQFFEDAGEGYGYTMGEFHTYNFVSKGEKAVWTLQFQGEGKFDPTWTSIRLFVWGLPFKPSIVIIDDVITEYSTLDVLEIRLTKGVQKIVIQ